MSLDIFLGYFTGIGFFSQELSRTTVIGTTLFVHFLDGVVCRLFASHNGYSKNLWTLLGLLFGVWAIAALILLPKREQQ